MTIERITFDPQVATEMKVEGLREVSGLRVHDVDVPDGYEGARYRFQRMTVRKILGSHEAYLRENPDITYESENNRARDYLDAIPAIKAWKQLMPSAMALYPLQRPEEEFMPGGARMDVFTRELFRHGLDAVGIRSRAKVMEQLMLQKTYESSDQSIEWLSLACGAAVPVLDAIGTIKQQNTDVNFNLSLIDHDATALKFAEELAVKQGLEKGIDFTTANADLIRGLVLGDALIDELGEESKDMIDMLGIFEYFDDKRASRMLANALRLLKPGGTMIIGNMLTSHPNIRLNEAAVGWPSIKPRSIETIASVIESAGIAANDCDVYIPADGVYAVIEIQKRPATVELLPEHFGAAALSLANQ